MANTEQFRILQENKWHSYYVNVSIWLSDLPQLLSIRVLGWLLSITCQYQYSQNLGKDFVYNSLYFISILKHSSFLRWVLKSFFSVIKNISYMRKTMISLKLNVISSRIFHVIWTSVNRCLIYKQTGEYIDASEVIRDSPSAECLQCGGCQTSARQVVPISQNLTIVDSPVHHYSVLNFANPTVSFLSYMKVFQRFGDICAFLNQFP